MSMLLALVSCSGGTSGTNDTASDNTTAGDQAAESSAGTETGEETSEEPASEEATATKTGTLKIGLMVHQTGWFAGVDTPNYNEFTAMVDYVNNDLGGWQVGDTIYTIDATYADGQSDYTALRTAAMSLVDAGVDYVVETNDFWVNSCADVFED
jgi:ABC-type branched-subunit amino acid transport system substrate-binding protein